MSGIGGFHDHVARVDLSEGAVQYEGIDRADAEKYIGARGLGAGYVFDRGPDDDLPDRFVEGREGAIPAQGPAEGGLVELEELEQEYYEVRGWVDGVVPDEKLDGLDIDVGPGTGVSSGEGAPADD